MMFGETALLAATAPPSTFAGIAEAAAIVVLLTEFAMLRSALSRSQIRLYAFQSLVVAVLAAVVGATHHLPDLFALAALSLLLKVVAVPAVILRLLGEEGAELASGRKLGVATMVLIALVVAGIGLFLAGALHVNSRTLPAPALGIALAIVLVAFLLAILRGDVVSQAIGFFSLENGIQIAGLVVAARLPILSEVAFLFDLLVAVVAISILIRVHHGRTRTLSVEVLDQLKG